MITSDRKFGVELEFLSPDEVSHRRIERALAPYGDVVFDGSLRPHPYGGEWVSPVLQGKTGEAMVRDACDIIKVNHADLDDPRTSMHIHLDGKRPEPKAVKSMTRPETGRAIAFSRAVARRLDNGDALRILTGQRLRLDLSVNETVIDNIRYFSMGRLSRHPRMNYVYYHLEEQDNFDWLQKVFYFYTKHSQAINSMVSRSRCEGNMYCQPLHESFTTEAILGCKDKNQLERLWYKGLLPNGRYNDSRYHNVNLHSYFFQPGTIEIRSHGSTSDANKILLWIRLHQFILDKLERVSIDDIKNDLNPMLSFLKFISEEPLLVDYYKRTIGYYHGISIVGDKVKYKD